MTHGWITPPHRSGSGGEEKNSATTGHRSFSQSFYSIIPAELTQFHFLILFFTLILWWQFVIFSALLVICVPLYRSKKHTKHVGMDVTCPDDCRGVVKLKESRKESYKFGDQTMGRAALLCGYVALGLYWYENLKRCVFVALLKTIDLRSSLYIRQLSLSVSSWNNVRVIVRRQVARTMQKWTIEHNTKKPKLL
jgi:hypothetical protein